MQPATVSNMAAASVMPSKVREKWQLFRALDGVIVRVHVRTVLSERCVASWYRDDTTAVPHHHGVGHSAAFSERIEFPTEFGEYFSIFFHAYAHDSLPRSDQTSKSVYWCCRYSGINRFVERDCCIAALAKHAHGSIRLDSARLFGADRPLYLIWRRTDSRARERESTERERDRKRIWSSLYIIAIHVRDAAESRSPARKARRTKNISVI